MADDDNDLFTKVPSGAAPFVFRLLLAFGILILGSYLALGFFFELDVGGCASRAFMDLTAD
ncbi:MAG: hypothetical protein GX614_01020 [Sandaracinaceae bacterium]|nr:hypothetical protein [Sandaracinaceae bacterium]